MTGCPHINLTNPETFQGGLPREVFRYLRSDEPVYWHEGEDGASGYWVVSRQQELEQEVKRAELIQWIRDAGRTPVERDTLYNVVWEERELAEV